VIGIAGGIPILVLGDAMPMVAAAFAIALTAIVTGATHLDGLADTADALLAMGPGAAERARRDPAVGVGGIVTLILILILEVASLDQLIVRSGALAAACAMVVAATVSRFGPLLVTIAYGGRATESGLGAWFASRLTRADVVVAALTAGTVVIAVGLTWVQPWVIVAGASGLVVGLAVGAGLVRLRGQLDGDLIGATVELMFLSTLLFAAAFASIAAVAG
jgi:adenosylcobinamide-GDP ribazoletransferase